MNTPATVSNLRSFYVGQLWASVLCGMAASVVSWNLPASPWSDPIYDEYFRYAVYIGYLLGEMSMAVVWLVFGAGRVRTRIAALAASTALATVLFVTMPIARPTGRLPNIEVLFILAMLAGMIILLGPPLFWMRFRGGLRLRTPSADHGPSLPETTAAKHGHLQFGIRHLLAGMAAVAVVAAGLHWAVANDILRSLTSDKLTTMLTVYVVFASLAAWAIARAALASQWKSKSIFGAMLVALLWVVESFVWEGEFRPDRLMQGLALMFTLNGFLALVLIAHCLTTRWAGYRLVRSP